MTDECMCDIALDHAIGCPDQHASVEHCYHNCERREIRMHERFCPRHGVFATGVWPDRVWRFSERVQ